MEYRLSFLLLPTVSWAAVISTPFSNDENYEFNKIHKPDLPPSSPICTSDCDTPSSPLQIRDYSSYHPHSIHSKYDEHSPSGPRIPTSWKVAIGVNAFVLLITASILGMLVWILRKEYRKRKLLGDPAHVGAKDGFGRRMQSARNNRASGGRGGSGRSGRARAWSYDPIREEEEGGNMGEGVLLEGLGREQNEGEMSSMPMSMRTGNPTLLLPAAEPQILEHGNQKARGEANTKAKRAWRGKHVRFSNWGGEIDPRDSIGVVAENSGKENVNGAAALRAAEAHEYAQTP